MKSNTFAAILVTALSLCLATTSFATTITLGDAVPLDSLIDGSYDPDGDGVGQSSLEISGKTFDGFSYAATGDMPGADGVNVIPIQDCDGNVGIRFQGGWLDLPGNSSSDALIAFNATISAGAGMVIDGVHLAFNGSSVGGGGFAGITETFLPLNSPVLNVYDDGMGNVLLSDWAAVDPGVMELNIQKDIILNAGTGVAATMSFVDQTFSMVPEPNSMVLLLIGFAGFIRRRR